MKNKWIRLAVYAFLIWLIPFAVSMAFYDSSGNLWLDRDLFKSIMIVLSCLAGCYFLVRHYETLAGVSTSDSILTGFIWLAISWLLDFAILLPLSGMSLQEYFFSIGLRYLQIPIMAFFVARGFHFNNHPQ